MRLFFIVVLALFLASCGENFSGFSKTADKPVVTEMGCTSAQFSPHSKYIAWGGDTIPHKDITHRNAIPFRSETTVFIHQQSKKKEGDNDYFLNPHVQFFMPDPDVKLGTYAVDMLKNSATMYVYKFLDPNDPNNNNICVWGVAIGGSINVTLAQNTALLKRAV